MIRLNPYAQLKRLFAEDAPDTAAGRRIDLLVARYALVVGLLLVAADAFQRWITPSRHVQLDIDGHYNIETWVHATILSLAAACALGIATTHLGRQRTAWILAGVALAFFSLDKSVSLHEFAGRDLVNALGWNEDWGSFAWIILWSPLLLASTVALIACVRNSDAMTQRWVVLGLLLGSTKVVFDPAASILIHAGITSEQGWLYGVEANIEETFQLLAFSCFLAGFSQQFVTRIRNTASVRAATP